MVMLLCLGDPVTEPPGLNGTMKGLLKLRWTLFNLVSGATCPTNIGLLALVGFRFGAGTSRAQM